MNKIFTFVLATALLIGISSTQSYAKESANAIEVKQIEVIPTESLDKSFNEITTYTTLDNQHESDWINDKLGYYDYKVEVKFALDSNEKFKECKGYISKKIKWLASANPNFTVLCEIENATHSVSSNKDKITIEFDMVYEYSPDWFGDSWTEHKKYVLKLDEI